MSKYLVYKTEDMERWLYSESGPLLDPATVPKPIEDAVVIRRQDMFAPPALDSYSNSIQAAIEAVRAANGDQDITEEAASNIKRLRDIADYFHDQASISWDTHRKLPD